MAKIRRQASLGGGEFKRAHDQHKKQIKLVLAQVVKVHHRYNTVDVQSLSGNVRINKTGDNDGKFSARLPVQFSGRTLEGQPFGQTTPVEIGTLVLVGFVDGDKQSPVVISIYGSPEEAEALSRSSMESTNPDDEEYKKETQHQFTVYPSLTYDDVDGEGNRTVSFNGKSFFATDSDADPDMNPLTDDGHGTAYEELSSSYYYTGELISPKDKKAPAILFRHTGAQSTRDGQELDDDHVSMLHFAQDGTYRVSTMREAQDWRTFFELTANGTAKMRRQNDSKAVGQGNDVSEVAVDGQGVLLRAGDQYARLTVDGWTGNAGGFGGGGGDVSADIERLRNGLLELGTSIEQTDEYVRITAREVRQDVEGQLTEFEATFEVTARQIESRVTETITNLVTDELQDVIDNIDLINENAEEVLKLLDTMVDDGILTPMEKKTLIVEWDMIITEYPGYIARAELVEVDSTEYTNTFNTLMDYVTPLFEDMEESSNVERLEFMNNFRNYFTARSNLLYNIFKIIKEEIDESARVAIEAGIDANVAIADSATAMNNATRANDLLANIAEDNVLTPQEKPVLRREYRLILNEWENYVEQAEEYGVSTTSFVMAKDAVTDYIETSGIFEEMRESTTVDGAQLQGVFATYYEERTDLLKRVSDETLRVLLEFEGDLEHFETSITETAREIALMAQSVQLIGREVSLNRAEISIQSDRIRSRVTSVEMEREVNTNMQKLNNVGRNLAVRGTASNGELNQSNGQVVTGSGSGVVTTYIEITPLTEYVLTAFDNNGNNTLVIAWYDMTRTFMDSNATSGSGDPLSLPVSSPAGARYARVSSQQRNTVRLQFEANRSRSPFKASPEDMIADLEVARVERDSRLEVHETYKGFLNDARAEGMADLEIIGQTTEDDVLTPEEKVRVQEVTDRIDDWHEQVQGDADAFNEGLVSYTGAYVTVTSYIEQYLMNMEVPEPVVGRNAYKVFDEFYEARTRIYESIETKTRESYEAADEILDRVSNSALEAQQLAEQMREEAEQAARNATAVREAILELQGYKQSSMAEIASMASDGTLTAEEKIPANEIYLDLEERARLIKEMALVYSLSTSDVDNSLAQLSSYLSPMMAGSTKQEDSTVSQQTFVNNYEVVFNALESMLDGTLDGATGVFDELDDRARAANDEYVRRQNQMALYNNAIKDSVFHIERLERKIDDFEHTRPILLRLISSRGEIFRNNNIETELRVEIMLGDEDVTERIPLEEFMWSKLDENGNEDTEWNRAHEGVGPVIDVTHEDVFRKATFSIDIDKEVIRNA